MKFNKSVLAVAVAAALSSGSAFATVNLDTGAGGPVAYANEASVAAAGTNLSLVAGAVTEAVVQLGIAVGAGQSVYARFDLDNGAKFNLAPNAVCTGGAVTCALVSGGAATSFAIFQITAPAAGLATLDTITIRPNVGGGFTVVNKDPVTMRYRLFGNQGNAQDLVGTPNKDASKGFISFADSYELVVTVPTPESTADVAAVPPFTKFTGEATTTRVGDFNLRITRPNANGTIGAYLITGVPITQLGDLLANTSNLTVAGDFTVRAATNSVRRIVGGCGGAAGTTANPIADASAVFSLNTFLAAPGINNNVCYTVNGQPIPASDYTVTLNAVANLAGYTVRNLGPLALGRIVRNGTTLQAPLAQIPPGWGSRIVLTNTGTVDRTYTVRLLNGMGNTVTSGNLTGTIPAGQFVTHNVTPGPGPTSPPPLVTSIAGGETSTTVVVDVVGPNTQIQGLYQLWQISTGNITNHVMVRPGSN